MDMLVWIVLGAVLMVCFWKLRRTFRFTRQDRGQEIQAELARLRQQRSEESQPPPDETAKKG